MIPFYCVPVIRASIQVIPIGAIFGNPRNVSRLCVPFFLNFQLVDFHVAISKVYVLRNVIQRGSNARCYSADDTACVTGDKLTDYCLSTSYFFVRNRRDK